MSVYPNIVCLFATLFGYFYRPRPMVDGLLMLMLMLVVDSIIASSRCGDKTLGVRVIFRLRSFETDAFNTFV